MPRQPRLEYPGAFYHVTSRTNRGEPVFGEPAAAEGLLAELGAACGKTGWRVHAYCVLPDHVHLVIETPRANLVSGMKWWLATFSYRYNRRHGLRGHLFGNRYRAVPVDPEGPYFLEACVHVLLNPARAGLLAPEQALEVYPGSSLAALQPPLEQRPAWLAVDRLLAAAGFSADPRESYPALVRLLESRRCAPVPHLWRALRRGWCFGSEAFRGELLKRLRATTGNTRRTPVPPEAQIQLGRMILAEELARLGWNAAELMRRRKTDPAKVAIAQRLRRETPLSLRWIAAVLYMGSPYTVRNALLAAEQGTCPSGASTCATAASASAPFAPPVPEPPAQLPALPPPPPEPSEDFSVTWD